MKKIFCLLFLFVICIGTVYADMVQPPTDRYCINKKGQKVQCPDLKQFYEKEPYKYHAFQDSSKKWGLKDNNDNIVIPAKYDFMTDFNEGLAGACINDKCGYIDIKDKWVIKPKFPLLMCQEKNYDDSFSLSRYCGTSSIFHDGMAAIYYEPKHVFFSYIDKRTDKSTECEPVLPEGYTINHGAIRAAYGEIKNNKFY